MAQKDYRRGLIAAKGVRPAPYNAPPMARLCDEMLFGSQLARHRAAVGPDDSAKASSRTPRRCLAPSFMMLIPTCLMGTIAQTTLTPILPELKQQFFGTGHEAATVSGWTDSLGYCIGFVVAGVIGRLSDCYVRAQAIPTTTFRKRSLTDCLCSQGRRSIIIAQKVSSLICLAALAFRAQLNNNLWIYIGLGAF